MIKRIGAGLTKPAFVAGIGPALIAWAVTLFSLAHYGV
jgi:hypothetical protein